MQNFVKKFRETLVWTVPFVFSFFAKCHWAYFILLMNIYLEIKNKDLVFIVV